MAATEIRRLHRLFSMLQTGRRGALSAVVDLLQVQLDILRERLPGRIRFTAGERRRLRRSAAAVGDAAAADFLQIVSPATCERWGRKASPKNGGKRGRPPKGGVIEDLIVKLATENDWGCTRILAELRKLGLERWVSRTTVRQIMIKHGFDPDPRRGPGSWADFIQAHLDTLWACDFFTKPVHTPLGIQEHYVLFFKQVGTRRVVIAGATPHPNKEWTTQQARNFVMELDALGMKATYLIRDRDTKFLGGFDAVMKSEGIEVVQTSIEAPEMNGYAESFVGTIKRECLDHFIAFSGEHLTHLLREFETYYNTVRPHRGMENRPIGETEEPAAHTAPFTIDDLVCDERLGGRLRHYRWKAAA